MTDIHPKIKALPLYCSIYSTDACDVRRNERENIKPEYIFEDIGANKGVKDFFLSFLQGEPVETFVAGETVDKVINGLTYDRWGSDVPDQGKYVALIQEALLSIPGLVSNKDKKDFLKGVGGYGDVTASYVSKVLGFGDGKLMTRQFMVTLFKMVIEVKKNKNADWKTIMIDLQQNKDNKYSRADTEVIDYLKTL
jgi:hypothetical protein